MGLNNQAIGVFDSGLGGLTVAKEIMEQLPQESILYFGDTARVPYGPKAPEDIVKFSLECLQFLVGKGAKIIVIACNTVSVFLDTLQAALPVPVIGVIEAGARSAVDTTRGGAIGVIATDGTVNSGAYTAAIKALNDKVRVHSQASPMLAPMVEEGWFNNDATLYAVKTYLEPLLKEDIDTLVLGCTHYPMLRDTISTVAGSSIRLVDPAAETVRQVAAVLKQHCLDRQDRQPATYRYFVSSNPDKFANLGQRFLGRPIDDVTLANLSLKSY